MRALAIATLLLPSPALAEDITIFAAASLKNALDAIATNWTSGTGDTVTISYGGSPTLAKQIIEGAPADLYLSASTQWMDELAKADLIQPATRRDLLGNSLVLVAAGAHDPVTVEKGFDLPGLLGDGKLSMALIDSVPAGQYGKEALENLGVWASVEANVAQSENVRAALALVATGEALYGIVYSSDAIADDQADNRITVVGTFPENSHKPIVYPAALTATAKPEAKAFLDALSSATATAVFKGQGFTVLK